VPLPRDSADTTKQVSACRSSIRRKAFSGETESYPHGSGDGASSDSRVYSASTSTSRKVGASTESGSGGFGFRLGRACG